MTLYEEPNKFAKRISQSEYITHQNDITKVISSANIHIA
jgi:hypothetical protein